MASPFHECSIERFEAMISPYPKLAKFWHFNGSLSELTLIDDCKVYMNQNERLLFRFFKAVWTQDEKDIAAFNYIEAAYMFEEKERKLLLNFLSNPFLP